MKTRVCYLLTALIYVTFAIFWFFKSASAEQTTVSIMFGFFMATAMVFTTLLFDEWIKYEREQKQRNDERSTDYDTFGKEEPDMNFGTALEALKNGKKVYRLGWNGVGMWLELQRPDQNSKMTHPYVYIEYPTNPTHHAYPDGSRIPWLPSQSDMLADDWKIKA